MYQRLKAVLKSPLDEKHLADATAEITSLLPLGHNLPFLGLALGIVARLEFVRKDRLKSALSVALTDEYDMGEIVAR